MNLSLDKGRFGGVLSPLNFLHRKIGRTAYCADYHSKVRPPSKYLSGIGKK